MKLDKKYFWVATTIYYLIDECTFGVLALNKIGTIDLHYKNSKTVKDLSEAFEKFPGLAEIHENIKDETKSINTLIIGDSNSIHYLDYFSKVLNFKYVELHGSLQYGHNVAATSDYFKKEFEFFYTNEVEALSQMPFGSRVILANMWQPYLEEYKFRKDTILNVLPQYKDDVMGGIIADIGKLASNYSKLHFYVISQPVIPLNSDIKPYEAMYYLGSSSFWLKKVRELLGFNSNENFKPKNQYIVEKINDKLKRFADNHDNVYFIDRNIPVCKNKDECYVVIDGKLLYSDTTHLSIYGGELVGKFILKKIEEIE